MFKFMDFKTIKAQDFGTVSPTTALLLTHMRDDMCILLSYGVEVFLAGYPFARILLYKQLCKLQIGSQSQLTYSVHIFNFSYNH
ncbi:hypothetical protein DPMN_009203 [Dreissena polymorpha]|uniref:Uncharacterized protein n=1 Tax=Dreissena polymorpha TaxID=45954 RepID=A0A9D4RZU8_DREPO|nr:hypothetical protein DPMN_009203 [Dreissena polymorpha]